MVHPVLHAGAPALNPMNREKEVDNDTVPTKTQLSNFLGTPEKDYFKGTRKSLNFYFVVIWWGHLNGDLISQQRTPY